MAETKQPKEKRVPPVRASQPTLGIGGRERPNIIPREVSRLNGNGNGDPGGNRSSHGHGSGHMKMEDQVGMETHQGKETPKEGRRFKWRWKI